MKNANNVDLLGRHAVENNIASTGEATDLGGISRLALADFRMMAEQTTRLFKRLDGTVRCAKILRSDVLVDVL